MSEEAFLHKLTADILSLKKQRNAVILSHLYQRPEVQDIADFVGDSLGLAQQAAATDAEVIVFCGVHFMAESAAILSPEKIVLLPDAHAGCPMADMVDEVSLTKKKLTLPDVITVCYVNTSAEVKAECDIACTSANAEKVIHSLPLDKPILFVPDKNLGSYVVSKTGREMVLWEGCCNTHDRLTAADVLATKAAHPDALVLVHPECKPEVVSLANVVSSTTGMIDFARTSEAKCFIIGTEEGILHQLHKQCPDKEFYLASDELVCPNMKKTTLEKVHRALVDLEPRVTVPRDISTRAVGCLNKMLVL